MDVEWQKDGHTISQETLRGDSFIQIPSSGKKLSFLSSRKEDSGRYVCIMRNSAGESRKVFDFTVNVPPTINDDLSSVNVQTIIPLDTLELKCVVAGSPYPKVSQIFYLYRESHWVGRWKNVITGKTWYQEGRWLRKEKSAFQGKLLGNWKNKLEYSISEQMDGWTYGYNKLYKVHTFRRSGCTMARMWKRVRTTRSRTTVKPWLSKTHLRNTWEPIHVWPKTLQARLKRTSWLESRVELSKSFVVPKLLFQLHLDLSMKLSFLKSKLETQFCWAVMLNHQLRLQSDGMLLENLSMIRQSMKRLPPMIELWISRMSNWLMKEGTSVKLRIKLVQVLRNSLWEF